MCKTVETGVYELKLYSNEGVYKEYLDHYSWCLEGRVVGKCTEERVNLV